MVTCVKNHIVLLRVTNGTCHRVHESMLFDDAGNYRSCEDGNGSYCRTARGGGSGRWRKRGIVNGFEEE